MRIGVISDIHNNVVALDAVLDRFHTEACDMIICCGDIIGIGPYPEETVRRIMGLPNMIAVRGNLERYLLEDMPTQVPNEEHMGYEEMEHHHWEHALLSSKSIEFLKGLPYRREVDLGGLQISIMHYCMDNTCRYIRYSPRSGIEACYQMFWGINADIILYGHDHNTTIHQDENRLFANCGSLGCPSKDGNVARAGILTIENQKASFESIQVMYDVGKVLAAIDRFAYPAAKDIKKFFYGIDLRRMNQYFKNKQ